MYDFNRLGLFGLPPGTLDEEDKIAQPLTEEQLRGFSRFGDIGLPNQTGGILDTVDFEPDFGFVNEYNPYGEGGA